MSCQYWTVYASTVVYDDSCPRLWLCNFWNQASDIRSTQATSEVCPHLMTKCNFYEELAAQISLSHAICKNKRKQTFSGLKICICHRGHAKLALMGILISGDCMDGQGTQKIDLHSFVYALTWLLTLATRATRWNLCYPLCKSPGYEGKAISRMCRKAQTYFQSL